MIYTTIPLPFVLLVAVASQPLLFPTRDVVVEVKNEVQGVISVQELLFSAKERRERINEKGQTTGYTILDHDQNLMIGINLGNPPTYDITKLPENWNHIHYVKTGADKEIAGLKCSGWRSEEMTFDNGMSQRETVCITDDGVVLQSIADTIFNGQHTRSVQEATKVVYGPLDPLQFKIPVGTVRQ